MASFVFIEDINGDTIEANVYCSDSCAQFDPNYAGWNSCHEIEFDTPCSSCKSVIQGTKGELI